MAKTDETRYEPGAELGADGTGELPIRGGEQDAGSLDQLRTILLGPVSRGLEHRLEEIEGRFNTSIVDLVERTQGLVSELDGRVSQELSRFEDRLETQDGAQAERHGQLRDYLDSGLGELRQKTEELGRAFAGLHDDLRAELSRHVEQLKADLDERTAELRSEIVNEVARLQDAVVDRTYLASLLSEVAIRLNPPALAESVETEPDIDLDHLIGGTPEDASDGAFDPT